MKIFMFMFYLKFLLIRHGKSKLVILRDFEEGCICPAAKCIVIELAFL